MDGPVFLCTSKAVLVPPRGLLIAPWERPESLGLQDLHANAP